MHIARDTLTTTSLMFIRRQHIITCNVCMVAVLSCGEAGGAGGARVHKRYVGLYTGPYFDPSAPNNITTQLGTHAYLPCKVSICPHYPTLLTIPITRCFTIP